MKKRILHIIFSLGRGGAETLLVEATNRLTDYDNIILTLFDDHHFKGEIKSSREICFNLKIWHLLFFPVVAWRIRRLIKQEKIDLVHTHLYWPTVIARFATPRRIPLVTTVHAFVSKLVDYDRWYLRLMDRLSFRFRKSAIIAVAKGALDEYSDFQKKTAWRQYVVYTFADPEIFANIKPAALAEQGPVKLIAVGALRYQKNYPYLINAFQHVPSEKFLLDIYGIGDMMDSLKAMLQKQNVSVYLKGQVNGIQQVMPQYHVFVMASHYEGFSLAVLEAMMMGMPLLLSDIPSFTEQCEETATYFSIDDETDLARKLNMLVSDPEKMYEKVRAARERALTLFTPQSHLNQLRAIYAELLDTPAPVK